jgi:cyclomaltodextrinase
MIERQAITHIPLSQYAFTNSETSMTIRIRTAKDNLLACTLWYGDRVYPKDPILFTPLSMEKVASDLYFDYYEVTFESPYTRVCYYFELEDQEESTYLYADIFSKKLPKERSEFYQYPFMRREEISTVPEWLKHAVVYNIFPDSFASGYRTISASGNETTWERGLSLHSRLGGTIPGITENLDYIAQLGFNCIYLNPLFVAGEYHKYDILDYHHVCPNMGTDADFHALVDKAHEMGLRVVIDGVFNHCSWQFFAFDDVVHYGESSRYKDWFYDLRFPVVRPETSDAVPNYSCFAYERKMPKLNSSNPEVQAYFCEVGRYWIEQFHVDGWRLDVANELDRDFWRAFKKATRQADPESVMIGEIWESAESWLRGDMFDSAMNYDFRKNCRDFFGLEAINALEFSGRITDMMYRYPTGILQGQLNLLDSHDVNRFMSYCQNDIRRFRLAEVFLFTSPGAPSVFYGDELGMDGNSEFTLRGPMPWKGPKHDEREFFRQLITLRKENEALMTGTFQTTAASESGLLIYRRELPGQKITIALNGRNGTVSIGKCTPDREAVLSYEFSGGTLGPFGYAIFVDQ